MSPQPAEQCGPFQPQRCPEAASSHRPCVPNRWGDAAPDRHQGRLGAGTCHKSIKKLIDQSARLITEGSTLSSPSAKALAAILTGIREVSRQVAEIALVTSSQGQASAQFTDAIDAVICTTQENSALVEENSTACAALADQADQADQLEELSGMLCVG